ncbi:MAG: radical SAM protein [Bacteroidetes bacterium]|nr:MAG: radical SAM protein [Bacteroidota bacterium]
MISFPSIIQIETTILCNSSCVFCPQNEMTRGPKYMEEAVWKKIVDESRGKGILYRPFMINEPFVDPRLPEIIRYIRQDPTARVELNSNGHFVPKTNVPAIIEAGLDIVRFSIDGFSQEAYDKSGRGGKLQKIVDNVLMFAEERNRQKADCYIEVRMINMDFNRHEQQEFINFWSKHVDEAIVTSYYDWPWSGQTESFSAPCPKVQKEMFFMVDGQATLCCWDSHERGIVGDVKQNTVEELWKGAKMQEYKSYLNKGERHKILLCSKCDAYKDYDFSTWEGY